MVDLEIMITKRMIGILIIIITQIEGLMTHEDNNNLILIEEITMLH